MRLLQTSMLMLVSLTLALAACSAPSAPPPVASIPTIVALTATPSAPELTYQVQRGEIVDLLELRGRVAAAVDQDVFFTEQGYIKQLLVKRNDVVASGQLLAELDLGELPDQLTRAQADLATLRRQVSSTRQQRSYSVELARLSLQNAQDRLVRLQTPANAVAIQSAQDAIERARISLENTRNNSSAAKTDAKLAVERATIAVRNRQDEYSRVVWENGNRPLEQLNGEERLRQEQAERGIADAQTVLRQTEISYDLAVQNEQNAVALAERDVKEGERALVEAQKPPEAFDLREAERAVQQARVTLNQANANSESPEMSGRIETAQQSIAEIQQQIDSAKIYAPFDGVVAEVGVKPGDLAEAYAPVINVIDPDRLTLVVAEISSDDLARLGAGQKLEINFDRYPSETVAGVVEQLPSDQVSAGSLVRPDRLLRIGFSSAGRKLEVGDPALVTVVFGREPNALWLPNQAIYRFDQRTFVMLQADGGPRPVDITTGISTPDRVEIRSGLREGDIVVADPSLQ